MRIVTFNLKGLHEWPEDRDTLTIDGLRALDPDIVCLQEAAIQLAPNFYDQSAHLANALGSYNRYFLPYSHTNTDASDITGIAVLSRFPVSDLKAIVLPGVEAPDRGHTRGAMLMSINADQQRFHVVNTHLNWHPDHEVVRGEQIATMMRFVAGLNWDQPGSTTVLAGDFNAHEAAPCMRQINGHMVDAYRLHHPEAEGFTWLADNPRVSGADNILPNRRVDYLFVTKHTNVRQCDIVLNEGGFASDHFGLMADVDWS